MTDITKCTGVDCQMRDKCYRYTAPAKQFRQSWFIVVPIVDGKCEQMVKTS